MSKDNKLQLLSPLFLKYQIDFEKNPRSRVFAPLAEAYRKLGMTDKAMEILSQGIRFHPSYVMGYLGLAFCYFDLKQYNLAYSTLRPVIESNRDNLRLQKLFSDVCLQLGKQEEALETLKYLLFINPRDKEVAESVSRLEREVEERYKPQHKPIIIPEKVFISEGTDQSNDSSLFKLEKLERPEKSGSNDFDDWMAIDLSHESKLENKTTGKIQATTPDSFGNLEHWNVKKGNVDLVHVEEKEEAKFLDTTEEKRDFKIDLSQLVSQEKSSSEIKLDLSPEKSAEAPLVTHTLVDLYCGQGHIEKALEVLEKILLLNPNDQKTIKKIKEIQALVQPLEQYDSSSQEPDEDEEESELPSSTTNFTDLKEVSEEDGRRTLMSLIDEKLGPIEIEEVTPREETAQKIEAKLSLFLKKIQKRALDYQGRV